LAIFKKKQDDAQWISITDMMSGLMMVFLFIAVAFMIKVQNESEKLKKQKEEAERLALEFKSQKNRAEEATTKYKNSQESIKKIALAYQESLTELNSDLHKEFDKDLKKWGAEITEDNRIRFKSPDMLFRTGSSKLTPQFMQILSELFPRYVKLLTSNKYKKEINEIRIEGHTSYGWGSAQNQNEIYLNNMYLSQKRAISVLEYCFKLDEVLRHRNWLIKKFRANGMSYSVPILMKNRKIMDYDRSRRVEIFVATKAQEKIFKIIEKLQ
jgi:outer membrane protein OmpA-like peptidoglycan-associated protein